MGTHPIFESDFDCLTDLSKQKEKNAKPIIATGGQCREDD